MLTVSVRDVMELQKTVCDESLRYYIDKLMHLLTKEAFSEFAEELLQFLSSNEPLPYKF